MVEHAAGLAVISSTQGVSRVQVKEGDNILYFKWAGDQMETPEGAKFVVLHESDILCKT